MKIIVFAGPSIERSAIEAIAGAQYRPPVSQGDVFRAVQTVPDVIAIIDGYFEGVPSVWHKEILWAMSQGIQVFGASSMGALRAAELHSLGMRGVGEIFAAYRDGVYEDDDEVAVLHGPAEMDYRPLTLPMVNARATIEAAQTSEVIDQSIASELIAIAKSTFYQERNWRAIVRQANERNLDPDQIDCFERWLPQGERDLKREDAQALLNTLEAITETGIEPLTPTFEFEWTVMWDRVFSGQTGHAADCGETQASLEQAVLDELRLDVKRYRGVVQTVLLKRLALREAMRKRLPTDMDGARRQLQSLREAEGLYSRAELDLWRARNDWTTSRLERALEERQRSQTAMPGIDDADLLNELRLCGEYAALKATAMHKRAQDAGISPSEELAPAQLLAWYFETVLGEPIPAQLDDYLATIGIKQREEFYRMLHDHYCYQLAIDDEKQ